MNSEMEHNYEVGNAKNIQDKVSCFLSVYLVLHLTCTLYMQQVGVLSTLCNLHLDLIIVLLTLYNSYIYSYIYVIIQHRLERLRELGLNCRTTYLYSFFGLITQHIRKKSNVQCKTTRQRMIRIMRDIYGMSR